MTDPTPDHPAWPPVQRRLLGMVFAAPFYESTLRRRQPEGLSASPPDPWPGNADRAAAMLGGSYGFAGALERPNDSPWDEVDADDQWLNALHSFTWLRDLRALGGDDARRLARRLTEDWLSRHQRWSASIWRADIMGQRLVAWTAHFELFFSSAPDPLRSSLLSQMARQARHLSRTAGGEVDGLARLAAIKGLLYAGLCIPGESPLLARATRLLDVELPRQIEDDGAHVERSPAVQLQLLRGLVDIRAALSAGQQSIPPALADGIERAASMLRFFRHGDGGLCLFNDSAENDVSDIDLTLAQANVRKRPPSGVSKNGFQRLAAGKLLAFVDTGARPRTGWDSHAHAGTLSLEVSFGKERLVVNCGAAVSSGAEWQSAARATAAHSTLAIEDTNSSDDGGPQPHVAVERQEADGNLWLTASHNGYGRRFGLIHHRRLYLAAQGDELRGEDTLAPVEGSSRQSVIGLPGNRAYAIRFHFHPAVQASMVQDGAAVLLRLPGGTGWRLRASDAKIDLAESIYFGTGGAKRTQQVVLSGRTDDDGTTVKWALRREGGKT